MLKKIKSTVEFGLSVFTDCLVFESGDLGLGKVPHRLGSGGRCWRMTGWDRWGGHRGVIGAGDGQGWVH